ncbi:AraC family transcriptional regulator [Xanthomonas oryzae]|uniref:AraC family transcriptional regulator n=1 Tax=Xanthomonas oryzae TaxID=347 RepID=UPI000CA00712|nr:AraC family transcriptional regulator [Xanthomonas oryzae]RBA79504.1 AraC family transcriptional regulator [Xanthomonas oryzae pv. oryzae]RBB13435.1 AraC family transcriptional regulator [Xanthomonas oryzae pv. oryzae]RBB16079.1 AraC family transcriptional regulator [Xanthomonas oryzae pv. oryzae]RBB22291.1 AraC family transcriptional regulator [Xanthomonas oryzae pv. oryzae]RBB26779.1 AraC family transcriptional regulator [Xanthomonas oryzae pv. oryzae]
MTLMDLNLPALEMQTLFDALPDVVFFIKDSEGRYTHCNLTLVRRLGSKLRSEIIGHSPLEVFPLPLGGSYMMQDRRVLCGELIDNQLEVHLYPNRLPGWCLTFKRPLCEANEVIGVVGISRDLGQPDSRHSAYERLSQVMEHMQTNFGDNLRVQSLAALAGLSVAQLERHFRRVFQVTPQQLLTKLRIESAMRLLYGDDSIASIGQQCGFADQSAFARQFKATVGMTPRDYRALKGQL